MDIKNLTKIIEDLELKIKTNSKEDDVYFNIDNEILKDALTQQVRLHLKWENLLTEVNRSYFQTETYVDAAYSSAMETALTKSNVDYSTTEAKIIAQNDTNYIEVKLLFNKLTVLKRECESVLKALDTRKWILKGITDLVVNSADNHII